MEQALINNYGLKGQGALNNIRNSIYRLNPNYDAWVSEGKSILESIGYQY